MKKRRAGALLMVAAMVLSLAGCQSGNDVGKETGAPESTKTETSQNGGNESAGSKTTGSENPEKNLYGYDEPVSVKVGYAWGGDFKWYGDETSTDNTWVDLYKENNIIPEILYEVNTSQSDTKLSTAIMSGNYPDIIKAKTNDFVNYAKTGVIADITDAFEEYASDELKEYLAADSGLAMQNVLVDGRIYGLPVLGSSYDSIPLMFIRQDWLDKLGLKMPETMEELKAVAHAFTYDDPDGNGKNDTYGLALNGVNILDSGVGDSNAIFNAFGVYLGNDGLDMVTGEDGKVTWGGTNTEGMKQGLAFLQDLYQDGSLAKDFITMDSDAVFEEAGAGRCGIWFGPMWGAMNPAKDLLASTPDAHITSAPVPDGLDQGGSLALIKSSVNAVYCVSSQCKNPEVLIKLANLSVDKIVSPENEEEYNMYFGDYQNYCGWKASIVQLEKPNKNYDNYLKMSAALVSGDTSELNTEQVFKLDMIKAYLDAAEAGTLNAEDTTIAGGLSNYTVFCDPKGSYAALDQMIKDNKFVESAYNAFPTETMSENAATLKKLTVETIVKIITGDSVDNYDSFLKSWYALGGEAAIEEAQAWADANAQ